MVVYGAVDIYGAAVRVSIVSREEECKIVKSNSMYLLQVILILGLIHFQTGQISKQGLFQPKSTLFNPRQFVAGTKHRSPVVVLPNQKQP